MTLDILVYVTGLFGAMFILGTLLCLKLYSWDYQRYFKSQLWVKTYYWVPIFVFMLALLYLQTWAAVAATLMIAYLALTELTNLKIKTWQSTAYTILIIVAFAHLIGYFLSFNEKLSVILVLSVGFSSVTSDIFAYFFGNFFGKHKLPIWINNGKSWEGVFGQILGAVLGFLLVIPIFDQKPSFALALIVGLASALGDILNSIVKRQVGIKDWGNTIPGHGGVLDRFASLALALAAAYYFVLLIN